MKTTASKLDHESGYSMRLANGQGWHITATEGVMPWVDKLAYIMGLKISDQNGYPKLIFVEGGADKASGGPPIGFLGQKIKENLPERGWKARHFRLVQIWSHGEVPDVICEIGLDEGYELDILRMSLAIYPIFEKAQYAGGLSFHAGLVERNGMGILLAGSGNTGKSTCCRRLQSPWHSLCDDQTLVVRNDQNRYLAQPFPTWSDYLLRRSEPTWNVQRHVPLSAIFFLERAEDNEVLPVGEGQTAIFVNQCATEICGRGWAYLDREEVRTPRKRLFDNACQLAKAIPVFILRFSPDGRFWEEMEKVLR